MRSKKLAFLCFEYAYIFVFWENIVVMHNSWCFRGRVRGLPWTLTDTSPMLTLRFNPRWLCGVGDQEAYYTMLLGVGTLAIEGVRHRLQQTLDNQVRQSAFCRI